MEHLAESFLSTILNHVTRFRYANLRRDAILLIEPKQTFPKLKKKRKKVSKFNFGVYLWALRLLKDSRKFLYLVN